MCKEAYFGCECGCLNHVTRFSYFSPKTSEEEKSEDNVIYFVVTATNYFNRFFPYISFNPTYWGDDLKSYSYYNFFNRLPIAFKHIFNPSYKSKNGILDCMDFQKRSSGKAILTEGTRFPQVSS